MSKIHTQGIELRKTGDGSLTLYSGQFDETYHSVHGAITESQHVFIHQGFDSLALSEIHVFEMGFGTGLNAYLTYLRAKELNKRVYYYSVERFPVAKEVTDNLKYPMVLGFADDPVFETLHSAPWGQMIRIDPCFSLYKIKADILEYTPDFNYNLVYFDAFSPKHQGELWSVELFEKIYHHMLKGGVLTTYCAKGQVRRNLQQAGFQVERLPGPPGKREMLRGIKI